MRLKMDKDEAAQAFQKSEEAKEAERDRRVNIERNEAEQARLKEERVKAEQQARVKVAKDEAASAEMLKKTSKICPGCKRNVEKNGYVASLVHHQRAR